MEVENSPTDFHKETKAEDSSADSLDDRIERNSTSRQYGDEKEVEEVAEEDSDMPPLNRNVSSRLYGVASRSSQDPSKTVIRFADDDPEEPNNWSMKWKLYSIFICIMLVLNSTIASSLAAGATQELSAHFGVTGKLELVLPTSIYLVGYVIGPIFAGPLSEQYGRRAVMSICFFIFTIFSMATALAPNWAAFNIFRLIVGIMGSCPIAVVGGICADCYHNPSSRGSAMAIFMMATMWGPTMGPIFSGYSATISWRWPFWIGLIFAGATWPVLAFYRETYAPILLRWRAAKMRKERNDPNIVSPMDMEEDSLKHILLVVCMRALRMLFFEPLIFFTCLYLSLVYALFYIFFQSFPIIYGDIYGFSPGQTGLAFIPIGIGAAIACPIYLSWDAYLRRAQKQNKPWSLIEEYRRLPLACLAGPILVISLFWSGFTARKDIHWIVPVLSGLPFGIGYLLLFMAMLNYLVDAYSIYAASANAAASASRSLFGAVLPFAARPMYEKLGVRWASGTLGFICLAIAVIPFAFIVWGGKLRARSPFCQFLANQKKLELEKREKRGLLKRDEERPAPEIGHMK